MKSSVENSILPWPRFSFFFFFFFLFLSLTFLLLPPARSIQRGIITMLIHNEIYRRVVVLISSLLSSFLPFRKREERKSQLYFGRVLRSIIREIYRANASMISGQEQRTISGIVHKLHQTKPRNGRGAAKSKARSKNRSGVQTQADGSEPSEMKITMAHASL